MCCSPMPCNRVPNLLIRTPIRTNFSHHFEVTTIPTPVPVLARHSASVPTSMFNQTANLQPARIYLCQPSLALPMRTYHKNASPYIKYQPLPSHSLHHLTSPTSSPHPHPHSQSTISLQHILLITLGLVVSVPRTDLHITLVHCILIIHHPSISITLHTIRSLHIVRVPRQHSRAQTYRRTDRTIRDMYQIHCRTQYTHINILPTPIHTLAQQQYTTPVQNYSPSHNTYTSYTSLTPFQTQSKHATPHPRRTRRP